jgi:transposase
MQVKVKTLLNKTQPIPEFRYADVRLVDGQEEPELRIEIEAHAQRPGRCSICEQPAPTYDHLDRRDWHHVAPWRIPTTFFYTPRRVNCAEHGVRVEVMPWSEGKRPWTRAMMVFLARWARRLSWKETAETFDVSWEAVYRSVAWIVEWGLAHRVLAGITAIGLDELHWRKGKQSANFLTLIYQVDEGCRRLLWVGLRRTERSLRQGLKTLGVEVAAGLRVVVSDMWRPYLAVVRKHLSHAVQILDRFHLTALLNKAVDQVRRGEGYALRGQRRGQRLK